MKPALRKQHIFYPATGITLVLVIFLLMPACRQPASPRELSMAYGLQTEHKVLESAGNTPALHFQSGWREGTGTAVSPRPRLRFFNFTTGDRTLYLQIAHPETPEPMGIRILLNGVYLTTLEMADSREEYAVILPEEHLVRGSNILQLEVPEKKRSLETLRREEEPADYFVLSKAFFKGPPPPTGGQPEGRGLFNQPANSIFTLAVDPASTRSIELECRSPNRPLSGSLILRRRRPEDKTEIIRKIPLRDQRRQRFDLDLDSFVEPMTLEIEFSSKNRKSMLTWYRIHRVTKTEAPAPLPSDSPVNRFLTPKPHVFIIVIDAARYDAVNTRIDGKLTTPRIREFSQNSLNFTRFYANAPYTIASVGTLLTGFLPEVHTVRDMDLKLPEKLKTLPDYLEEAGYGSTGITSNVPLFRTNLLRDFEEIVICRAFGEPRYRNYSYVDLKIVNRTIRETDFTTPQLFYIHLLPPHTPYNPPRDTFDRFIQYPNSLFKTYRTRHIRRFYRRAEVHNIFIPPFNHYLFRAYLNNIFYADFLVGLILDTLQETGIFDDSLIIVTSDHGEAFFEHRKYTHNTTNYDEMIRVPFLLKMPGQSSGTTINHPYSLIDLLPTLAELLDLKAHPRWQGSPLKLSSDGRSGGEGQLIYSRANGPEYNLALIQGHFKYIYSSGREELYHLGDDPAEGINLVSRQPYRTALMREAAILQLIRNLDLKNRLNVRELREGKDPQEVIRELETLGYL